VLFAGLAASGSAVVTSSGLMSLSHKVSYGIAYQPNLGVEPRLAGG
jgi:hypothetical protein